MTARVNGTATTSGLTAANVDSTIAALNSMLKSLDSVNSTSSSSSDRQLQQQQRLQQDGKAIDECIECCLRVCSNLQLEARQIQERTKIQISAIYSLIAQRDNILNLQVAHDSKRLADASRRDSSAMKTIAVLTIVFIPGTFVAAFFAMPLFDWDASSPHAVLRPRFYVYWVVTIPATLLLVLVWRIWIRLNSSDDDTATVRSAGNSLSTKTDQGTGQKGARLFTPWRGHGKSLMTARGHGRPSLVEDEEKGLSVSRTGSSSLPSASRLRDKLRSKKAERDVA
ncbi:hypothetical protein MMC25_000956 [Agyrium rufum]|nr:hypothetical protein [Agyrium rufum]